MRRRRRRSRALAARDAGRRRPRRRAGDRRRAARPRQCAERSWTACASPTRPRSTPSCRVLAGRTNTAFVAAHRRGRRTRRRPDRRGRPDRPVEPGRDRSRRRRGRGRRPRARRRSPDGTDARCCADLLGLGYVPVVASIGVTREGALLNVNADTMAAHLAGAAGAPTRLIIAGATAGRARRAGRDRSRRSTLERLDAMIASGDAHSAWSRSWSPAAPRSRAACAKSRS